MIETQPFKFNRDYKDRDQVLPYWDGYLSALEMIDPGSVRRDAGRTIYDDEFIGKVPGLAGSDDEQTGVYMLRNLDSIRRMMAEVEAFKARGAVEITSMEPGQVIKCAETLCWGWYVGGTGIQHLTDVRVVERHGKPYAAIPKGKRTNGYALHVGEGRPVLAVLS